MNLKRIIGFLLSAALVVTMLSTAVFAQTESEASATADTQASVVGTVDTAGNPDFDSDSIVNTDDDQWHWLSYPESRMVLTDPYKDSLYDADMGLSIGLFVSGLSEKKSIQKIQIGDTESSLSNWDSCDAAWYPYKLTADASYGKTEMQMDEFFVDKDTFVRYMDLTDVSGRAVKIYGSYDNISKTADHSILVDADGYYFVYKVLLLNEDGSVNETLEPTVSGSDWSVMIPTNTADVQVAFSLTLGVKNTGDNMDAQTVLARANTAVSGNILDKLASTKSYWDGKLSNVPAPTEWGIQSVDAEDVTPEEHYRAFYAAWAFNYQNILEPTPETGYNYYQVTLGKASMWGSGAASAPNSCSWESMFDIQELALVEPEIAWSAAEGFIRSIDENGMLDGECLPSQKAHTVWVCYQNLQNDELLAELYPQIRQYLIWRANNPRWIYGGHNFSDEKDISFVTQWYSDVGYAIEICKVLGKYDDITMFENLKNQMDENVRSWFFTQNEGETPSPYGVYNSYFSDSNVHYAHDRTEDVPNYVYSALYADLPGDLTQTLVNSYLSFEDSSKPLAGFDFYKYGDGCNIAYGLLEKSYQYPELAGKWKEYINAALRSVIQAGEFAECIRVTDGEVGIEGVSPSSFGASTMIDFTYMNNGVRIDSGTLTAISEGNSAFEKNSGTDVSAYTTLGSPITLPDTVSVSNAAGETLDARVYWNSMEDTQFNTAGSFTVSGTIADTELTAVATVYVYGGTVTPEAVTVNTVQGTAPELPSILNVSYEQHGSAHESGTAVTWEDMSADDFSAVGTVTVGGTIDMNGQAVTATVNVIARPVITMANGSDTINQYDTESLSLMDAAGTAYDDVSWSISDSSLAAVSDGGILVAAHPGTLTVTAVLSSLGVSVSKEITICAVNTVTYAYTALASAGAQADSARSADKAIDEDTTTLWRAADNSSSQWFQLELAKETPLTGAEILWYTETQPKNFSLQVSADGETWETVYTRASSVSASGNYDEIIAFESAVSAKYIRMVSASAGTYTMGIVEFKVFGTPDITVPAQSLSITSDTGTFKIDKKGVTLQLGAQFTPANVTDDRVVWSIGNVNGGETDAASISAAGVVTPLKNGVVYVTATAVDGSGVSAVQAITITNQSLVNLALGKSVSATSSGGGANSPESAVDGDKSTRWGSASGASQSSYFTVNLGEDCLVSSVAIYFESGAYPVDFKLQYSADGKAWTDIDSITGNDQTNFSLFFDTVHARYIRTLSSKTTNAEWGYSIWEFEVYGITASSVPTPENAAAAITSLPAPAVGDAAVELPYYDGLTVTINSSSNEGVIALDGTITFPQTDTEVTLILTVSNGSESADTAAITVRVPGVKTAKKGDVDGDGQVTVSDVVELRDLIMKGSSTDVQRLSADLDANGTLTVSDVVELRDYIMKGIFE